VVTAPPSLDGVHELFVMPTRNTVLSDLLLGAAASLIRAGHPRTRRHGGRLVMCDRWRFPATR
jgi:hypothetical protein